MLRPADISVVKLRQVDSAFLNSLKNPYLRNSYTSQLIAGLSGSYIFNNQSRRVDRSSLMMRFNFETNGNLIDGLSRLFGSKERLADGEPTIACSASDTPSISVSTRTSPRNSCWLPR